MSFKQQTRRKTCRRQRESESRREGQWTKGNKGLGKATGHQVGELERWWGPTLTKHENERSVTTGLRRHQEYFFLKPPLCSTELPPPPRYLPAVQHQAAEPSPFSTCLHHLLPLVLYLVPLHLVLEHAPLFWRWVWGGFICENNCMFNYRCCNTYIRFYRGPCSSRYIVHSCDWPHQ